MIMKQLLEVVSGLEGGGSNLPGRFMLLETGIKNRYLFCSGEHGLWQTTNLGDYPDRKTIAVEQIEGQIHHRGATSIASVAVHPNDPNIIYTLMFRQAHRGSFRTSTNGGKSWENVSTPLMHDSNFSSAHIFQYSLTIDPENPEYMYFCVISNPIAEVSGGKSPKGFKKYGVLKSTNEGKTWKLKNVGLPEGASVRRIKLDPKNPSTLYAALNLGRKRRKRGAIQIY